jgi:hypothetical protein
MAEGYLLGSCTVATYSMPLAEKCRPLRKQPYTPAQALMQVLPLLQAMNDQFMQLPAAACPADIAVARLTLYPGFAGDAAWRKSFLEPWGLSVIGSEKARVIPRKSAQRMPAAEAETTVLFVAGTRVAFGQLASMLERLDESAQAVQNMTHMESIAAMGAQDRLYGGRDARVYEACLQVPVVANATQVRVLFSEYAQACGFHVHTGFDFRAGNLLFAALRGPADRLNELGLFTLLRLVRPMPPLQYFDTCGPDTDCSIAIATTHDQGEQVYGCPIKSLDLCAGRQRSDEYILYRALNRVESLLLARKHRYIHLGVGPKLQPGDCGVTAWTAVIDSLLGDGQTFLTTAGGVDPVEGAQPPKPTIIDTGCVNVMAVSATGRLADASMHAGSASLIPQAFHAAVGLRVGLQRDLHPLVAKALLVHEGVLNVAGDRTELAWGRTSGEVTALEHGHHAEVRILFQGDLQPGKYLRASLPMPVHPLWGNVLVMATFCYASPVNPQHGAECAGAALGIMFRPHGGQRKSGAYFPNATSFFSSNEWFGESACTNLVGACATLVHAEHAFRGCGLKEPSFDIHYMCRPGVATTDAIQFALVVTLRAARHPHLYAEVVKEHPELKRL